MTPSTQSGDAGSSTILQAASATLAASLDEVQSDLEADSDETDEDGSGEHTTETVSLTFPTAVTPPMSFLETGELHEPWSIAFYSPTCLICTGVNPLGTKPVERMKCRPEKNKLCPSGQVMFEFTGARRLALSRLQNAKESKDAIAVMAEVQAIMGNERLTEADRNSILSTCGII
jgi:hypothetical protein